MNWYYAEKGQQIGPIDEAAFDTLVASGQIQPTTLVWNNGMTDWKPVAELGSRPTPLGGRPDSFCSECSGAYPAEEMIQFGDVWVCANCKGRFTQKLREGVNLAGTRTYAGFWIRVLAAIIDGIAVGAVFAGVSFTIATEPESSFIWGLIGLQVLAQATNQIYLTSKFGGTIGKLALGLRVIKARGGNLSLAHATGRYFAQVVSSVTLGIGYIMAAFDEEKRTLHDRICDTRVVKK